MNFKIKKIKFQGEFFFIIAKTKEQIKSFYFCLPEEVDLLAKENIFSKDFEDLDPRCIYIADENYNLIKVYR